MTDTLTGLARAVADLAGRPDPAAAWALAQRIEAFAAREPRWEAAGRVDLLTKLARTIDPRTERDAGQALAVLRLASVAERWGATRQAERAKASEAHDAIRAAAVAGVPETRIAEAAGVDRMTVRRALGKR